MSSPVILYIRCFIFNFLHKKTFFNLQSQRYFAKEKKSFQGCSILFSFTNILGIRFFEGIRFFDIKVRFFWNFHKRIFLLLYLFVVYY